MLIAEERLASRTTTDAVAAMVIAAGVVAFFGPRVNRRPVERVAA
jgi:hypothetical protein